MTVPTTQATQVATILQRSVVLTLEVHYLGNDRKLKLDDLVSAVHGRTAATNPQTGDLEQAVRAHKQLIDRKELTPVMSVIERAKSYLRSRGVRAHRVFGDRCYLIPIHLVTEVDAKMHEFAAELGAEARLLAGRYRAAVVKQMALLGPLANLDDYLTPDQVVAEFGLDWSYVSFSAPEALLDVDKALFAATHAKYERRMSEMYEEVKLVLRETLLQLAGDIVKKLTPGDDGKPRVFRNTVLDGLADFLQSFEVRNITDDRELGKVVTRLRALTKGLDAEQLREIDEVRTRVLTEVKAAAAELDQLVVAGRRSMSFGGLSAA